MSSLLEEAIVDAKALKEAALKNAENTVLEKYAAEVKGALNTLLEQEELDLGLGGAPGDEAATDADVSILITPNGSDNIDGSNTSSSIVTQYNTFALQSDGSNWWIIS